MTAHTPGPWGAGRLGNGDHRIDARGWKELATVYGNEDRELARQGAANARLIAAAPELLEALMGLTVTHPDEVEHPCWCASRDEDHDIECSAARAAIAKATGGGT